MTFENRGHHNKNTRVRTGKIFGGKKFTAERQILLAKWEKLSNNERAIWHYKFNEYEEANL